MTVMTPTLRRLWRTDNPAHAYREQVLYKHDHLEKKLREHGRSAPAEILGMRTEGSGNSVRGMLADDDDLSGRWTLARLHLRVMPEGEPPFEATVRARLHTFKYKGDTVPVLYDPADQDKVVVDSEAELRAAAAPSGDFASEAAAFAEQAEEFREQAEAFRASTDVLRDLARAKAAGDQAEVARLKAEFLSRNQPG
jgi:hypothetical protein